MGECKTHFESSRNALAKIVRMCEKCVLKSIVIGKGKKLNLAFSIPRL